MAMVLSAIATFILLPVLKAEGTLPAVVDSRAPVHPAATGE
jgi:hypothetical protein